MKRFPRIIHAIRTDARKQPKRYAEIISKRPSMDCPKSPIRPI